MNFEQAKTDEPTRFLENGWGSRGNCDSYHGSKESLWRYCSEEKGEIGPVDRSAALYRMSFLFSGLQS
jgi:hypothetical protein